MDMDMLVAWLAGMCVLLRLHVGGNHDEPSMADAALRDHVVGKMLHLARLAAQHRDFKAATVIEMHMHGGQREIVMIVEAVREPLRQFARFMIVDIDEGCNARAADPTFLGRLPHAGTGEIADRFRTVLVSALSDHAVELGHEFVVQSNRGALHAGSRSYDVQAQKSHRCTIGKAVCAALHRRDNPDRRVRACGKGFARGRLRQSRGEDAMQKRRLGRSNLEIAPIVFGGNVFGWSVDQPGANRLLDAFVDAGFNAIDTANSYPRWVPNSPEGASETIIGKWLKTSGKRDRVLILTKVGSEMSPERKGLSRRHITAEVEGSLKRLGIEAIDLYQSHRDDLSTPMEETLQTYAELIREGKIRAIGASNFTTQRLKEAVEISNRLKIPRYEVLQPKYNLYDRDEFEGPVEDLCMKEQIGVIPYFGLASGFLAGKYRSPADFGKSAARGSRMGGYLNERGMKILTALDWCASKHQVKPAAIALSWLIARPSITAPIASATTTEQLSDFADAARIELDRDDLEQLNLASAG
jgi:aryl-alcohol dehydrogenase-like predicted oxidoreductase